MKRVRIVSKLAFVAALFSVANLECADALTVEGAECRITNSAGANKLSLVGKSGTITGVLGESAVHLSEQDTFEGGLSLTLRYDGEAVKDVDDDLVAYFLSPQTDVLTGNKVAVGTVFVSSKFRSFLPHEDTGSQYLLPLGSTPQSIPQGFRPWAVAECHFNY